MSRCSAAQALTNDNASVAPVHPCTHTDSPPENSPLSDTDYKKKTTEPSATYRKIMEQRETGEGGGRRWGGLKGMWYGEIPIGTGTSAVKSGKHFSCISKDHMPYACDQKRYAVDEWYGAGLAIARSWVWIPPTAAVYQRQLSVPSLRGRLMSTSESWGVNGHATRCTSPVYVVLRLRLVTGRGLRKRRSARPMGIKARERNLLYFTFL